MSSDSNPSIAVIGLGCRYPDAPNPAALWNTVSARRRAFRAVPRQRLSTAYLGDGVNETYLRYAAVLEDWTFDRRRFQVPPHVYAACDPVHWLALETAAAAVDDAGLATGSPFDRQRVSVVIGNTLTGEFSRAAQLRYRLPFLQRVVGEAMQYAGIDVETRARALAAVDDRISAQFCEPSDETLAGSLSNTIAGRVCNYFDFGGGGYTVDGACASSLLAITTGCRLLAAGEADVVIAGGVDLSLDPLELVGFARLGALAANEMRVFDANPTGFLPGEGCGIVVLVRSDDAHAHGLRPYAIVRGWGISSDGKGGITRPEVAGQIRAMRSAYTMAEVDPIDVRLVEGHGTGTAVGDAVELEALNEIRGLAPAALGSIKANIGHTKAAAGAASFIKTAIALHRRVLPPTTGVSIPHPLISPDVSGLTLPTAPSAWPNGTAHASVSSAGFGGINCHVVLSEPASARARRGNGQPELAYASSSGFELLPIAATGPEELANTLTMIERHAGQWSHAEFVDTALTASETFSALTGLRCVLVARSPSELAEAAAKAVTRIGELRPGAAQVDSEAGFVLATGRPPRIGLLFPGQAAPVRTQLSSWADDLTIADFDPTTVVSDGARDTAQAQPSIVRQSLAALAWLDRMGVVADAAVGHSLGEITALCWAHVLTPTVALVLAEKRGRIMAEYGRSGTGMTGVHADSDEVNALLAGIPVTIACRNGPGQTVVAGLLAELDRFHRRAAESGVTCTPLAVSHAFHSPAMSPAVGYLAAALGEVRFAVPDGEVISTVTGEVLDNATAIGSLLTRQLVEPVEFYSAVCQLGARCDLLVEVGPGTTLQGLAGSCVDLPILSCDAGGSERTGALTAAVLAATGAATPRHWRGVRTYRPRGLSELAAVLTNPCEADGDVTAARIKREPAPPVPSSQQSPPRPGVGVELTTLDRLRELFAERADVPLTNVPAECSPLRDLHLSSLEVRRCVTAVCSERNLATPTAALALSDATLAEISAALDQLPATRDAPESRIDGVGPWVRYFRHVSVPWSSTHSAPVTVVEVADDARLGGVVGEILANHEASAAALVLRHQGRPGLEALARTIALELPGVGVTVLDERMGPWAGNDSTLAAPGGYLELKTMADGRLARRVTMVRDPGESDALRFTPSEIILATGGAIGITARCAVELAVNNGGRVVVVGRTPDTDPAVASALVTLRSRSADVTYEHCDITDPASVADLIRRLSKDGAVTGLVHGAAVNQPAPLTAVTASSLDQAWAPKVTGLLHLLDRAGDTLRLVVGFGSIIGCFGLPGQADYAVANDGMRTLLEAWAVKHPAVRVRSIEWSLWAELGMGLRMDVIEDLRQHGVDALRPADGVQAFLRIVDENDDSPVTTLISSRFPPLATAAVVVPPDWIETNTGRFVENVRVAVPGVEVVAETALSYADDLYLHDHEIGGVGVVPAVLALEAFAQLGATLGLPAGPISFDDLRLNRPIDVPSAASATVRAAALRVPPEAPGNPVLIEATMRADADGYSTNVVSATMRTGADLGATEAILVPDYLDENSADALYESVLFHRGQLRRVGCFELLTAYRVRAWVRSDHNARWFSSFHDGRLRLGDPGLLDAALHSLLPTVPGKFALPIACARVDVGPLPSGWLLASAHEVSHAGTDYVFDLTVSTPAGEVVCRWSHLRLREVAPRDFPGGMPLPLVGPWLSRTADAAGLGRIDIISQLGQRGNGAATTVLTQLIGTPVTHTPEGRPVCEGGAQVSASYAGDALLAAAGASALGVDWQRLDDLDADGWVACLTTTDRALATALEGRLSESMSVAAARIWCAGEALRKATGEAGPLVLDAIRPDGLCVCVSGDARVLTARTNVSEMGETICALAVVGGRP